MEGKPQFILKRVEETVLQIQSRITCPAEEEPAKPTHWIQQELQQYTRISWVSKIFKWQSNPIMANWCTSRNTAFLITWSYLYYRNINHLSKFSISFSNCFAVQSFSNADLHSFQSYLSSKYNGSENMIKWIVAPTIISFFNFDIHTTI